MQKIDLELYIYLGKFKNSENTLCYEKPLILFRMGLFGAAHRWGAKSPLPPPLVL